MKALAFSVVLVFSVLDSGLTCVAAVRAPSAMGRLRAGFAKGLYSYGRGRHVHRATRSLGVAKREVREIAEMARESLQEQKERKSSGRQVDGGGNHER